MNLLKVTVPPSRNCSLKYTVASIVTAIDAKTARMATASFMLAASFHRGQGGENSRFEVKRANKAWRKCNLSILTAASPAQMAAAHWTSIPPIK